MAVVKIMPENFKSTEQTVNLAHLINKQQEMEKNRDYQQQRLDSLAVRLKHNDRTAADELVDIYYRQIYLYMRRLGHSCQVSEDLTQESFLQAWHHIGQLKDRRALNGWLYRIAGNVSKLYWRRHKPKESVSIDGFDVPDTSSNDLHKVIQDEQLEQLAAGIAKLPIKLKQVVVLHYLQDLTIADAANAAGVRQGTFKSRLNRALRALRKQII